MRLCTRCRCELPPERKAWMCTACKRAYDRMAREGGPLDKTKDKPDWQCARAGCPERATWRSPFRGSCWRACGDHNLQGDEPIEDR